MQRSSASHKKEGVWLQVGLIGCGLLALRTPVFAGQKPGTPLHAPKASGQWRTGVYLTLDRLNQTVGLTDAQRAKIKPILEEERRTVMAVRKKSQQKVEALLSPQQKAKLKAAVHNGFLPSRKPE